MVNDAVGAVVSTVIVRVDVAERAKLFDASLIADEFSAIEPEVPFEQSLSVIE